MAVGQYGPEVILSGVVATPTVLAATSITVKNPDNTAATLYTDSTGSTTTSNVVSTDARGNLTFFAAAGPYKLVYTDTIGAQTLTVIVYEDAADISATYVPATIIQGPGIDLTGATGSNTAFQALLDELSADGGGHLALPPDSILKLTTQPTMYSNITIDGGGNTSQILYTGSGKLFDLTGLTQVHLRNLRITTNNTAVATTLLYLSGTFRCSFTGVTIDGTNVAGTLAPVTQRGVELRGNSGDNRFIDCDLNNLGTGVATDSIMNYFVGCVWGTCRRSVHGDGGSFGAGISIDSSTMVGSAAATEFHVSVDTNANAWWITNSWLEGCDTAIIVGSIAAGGPYSFGLVNIKIAATTACVIINNARQSMLHNVSFEADGVSTPTTLTFPSPANAAEGVAANLLVYTGFEIAPTVFPASWTYIGRSRLKVPAIVDGPVTGAVTHNLAVITKGSDNTTVPHKVDGPSGLTANVVELGNGGTTKFTGDRFSNWIAGGNVRAGQTAAHSWTAGSSLYNGSGVPTIAGALGDYYFRKDAPDTVGARIYVCTVAGAAGAATWVATAA